MTRELTDKVLALLAQESEAFLSEKIGALKAAAEILEGDGKGHYVRPSDLTKMLSQIAKASGSGEPQPSGQDSQGERS